jgi:hypothetical protein
MMTFSYNFIASLEHNLYDADCELFHGYVVHVLF